MLANVAAARDMGGDEDALIVPEATIGLMFELALIDVQGRPPQLSRREGSDQRLTRIVPGFMAAKASRPISLVVSGVH